MTTTRRGSGKQVMTARIGSSKGVVITRRESGNERVQRQTKQSPAKQSPTANETESIVRKESIK